MRYRSLLLPLFVILLLTGCSEQEILSSTEYVAAGNGLCEAWGNEIEQLSSEVPDDPSNQELIDFSIATGRLTDDYTARLLELRAPADWVSERADLEARLDERLEVYESTQGSDLDALSQVDQAATSALVAIWPSCDR